MKQTQHGFGVAAVVVIVALLAIAGGAAYVSTKNEASLDTDTRTGNNNATGTDDTASIGTGVGIDIDLNGNAGGDIDLGSGSVDVDAGIDVDVDGSLLGKTHIVTYTDSGFSPKTLTVAAGDTVRFQNTGTIEMWVGADVHPTHTTYSNTTLSEHCPDKDKNDFDQCAIGNLFEFTFTKEGTWNYHNHRRATHTGTIVVE